mgnify:CR=1 FL=1
MSTPDHPLLQGELRLAGRLDALQFDSRGHFYAYAARVKRIIPGLI